MATVWVVGRLCLALPLLLAGVAKLRGLSGSKQTMLALGVPSRLIAPVAVAVAMVEVLIGFGLIWTRTAGWAGLAAAFLMVAFSLVVGRALAAGQRVRCHCFGNLTASTVGAKTLARNAGFALVGIAIAVISPTPGVGLPSVTWSAYTQALIVLSAAVAVLLAGGLWAAVRLMDQQGRILLRLDAMSAPATQSSTIDVRRLPIGIRAPAFAFDAEASAGGLHELLRPGRPVLLLFLERSCGPCRDLIPDVIAWQGLRSAELTIAVISGSRGEQAFPSEDSIHHLIADSDATIAKAYDIRGTPAGVMISPEGRVASPVAEGAHQIRALAEGSHETSASRARPELQGPDVSRRLALPSLDGRPFSEESLRGEPHLVVFWHPECSYCQSLLPDIDDVLRESRGTVGLVFVAGGSAAANAELAEYGLVVLDPHFALARRHGAAGTPSAILLDERVSSRSPLTAGAPDVLELIRSVVRTETTNPTGQLSML